MRGSAFKILAATPVSQQKLYEDLIFASLQKSVRCESDGLAESDGYGFTKNRQIWTGLFCRFTGLKRLFFDVRAASPLGRSLSIFVRV